MNITEEMKNEDEKRWHARNIVKELGYCGNYMRDRKNMTNLDIRFYAYIMRKAFSMLKEQEKTHWISVKDRMPDRKWIDYLVATELCDGTIGINIAWLYGDDGEWASTDGSIREGREVVTHWMPLPGPPKEESDA